MSTKDEQTVSWFLRILGGENYRQLAAPCFEVQRVAYIKKAIEDLAFQISESAFSEISINEFQTKRKYWLRALSKFCDNN